jgi:hypothetical protein
MKQTYSRRYRPRTSAHCEGKKGCHENFFGDPEQDMFFQPSIYSTQEGTIHRKCAHCETEEKEAVHRTEEKKEETVHRMEDKREKTVHRMGEGAGVIGGGQATGMNAVASGKTGVCSAAPAISHYIRSLPGKGSALPEPARQFFEARMGYDFSGVRIHTGEEAARSARAVHAKAYTTGRDIVFNEGQYDVSSQEGKKLLAHELTHVMQNGRGLREGAVDRQYKTGSSKDDVNMASMFVEALNHGDVFAGNTDPLVNGVSLRGSTVNPLKVPAKADLKTTNKAGVFESVVTKHSPTISTYKMRLPQLVKQWVFLAPFGRVAVLFGSQTCAVSKVKIIADGDPDTKTIHANTEAHEQHHVDDIKDLDKKFLDPYDVAVKAVKGTGKDAATSEQDAIDQATNLATSAVTDFGHEFDARAIKFHSTPGGANVTATKPVLAPDCSTATLSIKN